MESERKWSKTSIEAIEEGDVIGVGGGEST